MGCRLSAPNAPCVVGTPPYECATTTTDPSTASMALRTTAESSYMSPPSPALGSETALTSKPRSRSGPSTLAHAQGPCQAPWTSTIEGESGIEEGSLTEAGGRQW